MEAHNRTYFEEAWKKALDGAEVKPNPAVWSNIERELDGPSRKARHILLIKFAIAASFLFAMTSAGLYYTNIRTDQGALSANMVSPAVPEHQQPVSEGQNAGMNEVPEQVLPGQSVMPSAGAWSRESQHEKNTLHASVDQSWTFSGMLDGIRDFFMSDVEMPGQIAMMRVPVLPVGTTRRDNESWAGLNLSGGSMVASGTNDVGMVSVADFESTSGSMFVSRSETATPETNLNIGIGLGKKLSQRWLVQGGLNYTRRGATGTSNVIAAGDQVALAARQGNSYQPTEAYAVDHRLEYITAPVQVGYVLLDKKADITVLGGMSADVLVSHHVSDPSGRYSRADVTADSNFRKYGVSALLTAEVSYPLGEHYTVSAYPQVRRHLTSLRESPVSNDTPVSLEFGIRISYVF